MQHLPSTALILHDVAGRAFGRLRFSPTDTAPLRGDCIFDLGSEGPVIGDRPEVRWLEKRGYRFKGEHKFKVATDGTITVRAGDFAVTFEPAEDTGWRTRPPAPLVTAIWDAQEA